jgi:hypothetical protein
VGAFEEEMRSVGVDWQMNLYAGAKHSFTNPKASQSGPPEVGYHELSDRRSWRATVSLLDEVFCAVSIPCGEELRQIALPPQPSRPGDRCPLGNDNYVRVARGVERAQECRQ